MDAAGRKHRRTQGPLLGRGGNRDLPPSCDLVADEPRNVVWNPDPDGLRHMEHVQEAVVQDSANCLSHVAARA